MIHLCKHVNHPFHFSDKNIPIPHPNAVVPRYQGVYKTLGKSSPDNWGISHGDLAHLFKLSTRECYRVYYKPGCDIMVAETRTGSYYLYDPEKDCVDKFDDKYLPLIMLRDAPVRK